MYIEFEGIENYNCWKQEDYYIHSCSEGWHRLVFENCSWLAHCKGSYTEKSDLWQERQEDDAPEVSKVEKKIVGS